MMCAGGAGGTGGIWDLNSLEIPPAQRWGQKSCINVHSMGMMLL